MYRVGDMVEAKNYRGTYGCTEVLGRRELGRDGQSLGNVLLLLRFERFVYDYYVDFATVWKI